MEVSVSERGAYGYRVKEKEKTTEEYFAKLCIFTSGWKSDLK